MEYIGSGIVTVTSIDTQTEMEVEIIKINTFVSYSSILSPVTPESVWNWFNGSRLRSI